MIPKNLISDDDYSTILHRLKSITIDHKKQWGKMTVTQVLRHCSKTLEISLGILKSKKKGLLTRFIGKIFKNIYTANDKPFPKGSKTSRLLKVNATENFEDEKEYLLELLQKFKEHALHDSLVSEHPFFGTLTAQEWAILQYKHLDHHLRQFSA